MTTDWREAITQDPIPPWAIRAALEEQGLTQAQLAASTRVTLSAVEKWLSGARLCSGPSSFAVCVVLSGALPK